MVLLCLIPLASRAWGAPVNDLLLQGSMGFGLGKPLVIEDRWAPVFVRVINNGRSLHGELRVNIKDEETGTVAAVDIPEHSDKVFYLPLLVPGRNALFEVSLRAGRKEWAREMFSGIPLPPEDRLILLLAPDADPPQWMADALETFLAVSGDKNARALGLVTRPELLGADLETLHSIHAIVWDGAPLRGLGADTVSLLMDWVETGGILICAGGPDGSIAAQSALGPALPAAIGDLRPAALDGKSTETVLCRRLDRRRGEAAAGPEDDPWAVAEQRGRGRVVVLGFSLRGQAVRNNPLLRSKVAYWLRPTPPYLIDFLKTDWGGQLATNHNRMESRPAPFHTIAAWVLAYIALAGPVNFLLFRRLKRPEWAWVVGVALSAGACVFLYYRSPLAQERPISAVALQFVEPAGDGGLCRTRAMASVRSTRRRTVTLDVPPGAVGLDVAGYESAPLSASFYMGPSGQWRYPTARGATGLLGAPSRPSGDLLLGPKRQIRGLRLPAAAARSLSWTAWERRQDLPRLTLIPESSGPRDGAGSAKWRIAAQGQGPQWDARQRFLLSSEELPARWVSLLEPSDFVWPRLQPSPPLGAGAYSAASTTVFSGYTNVPFFIGPDLISFSRPPWRGVDGCPGYILNPFPHSPTISLNSSEGPISANACACAVFALPPPPPLPLTDRSGAAVAVFSPPPVAMEPVVDRWDWRLGTSAPRGEFRHLAPDTEIVFHPASRPEPIVLELFPRGTRADELDAHLPPNRQGRLANLWADPIPLDAERPMTFSLRFRAWQVPRRGTRTELATPPAIAIWQAEAAAGAQAWRSIGDGPELTVTAKLPLLGQTGPGPSAIDPWMGLSLAQTGAWTPNRVPASTMARESDLHLRLQIAWSEQAAPPVGPGVIVLSDFQVALSPPTSDRIARMTVLPPGEWLVEGR